jgi:hypothetical protein
MFAQTKLASAIAVAVGASALTISTAQAGGVFFHNLPGSPTVASIVSVMNTSQANYNATGGVAQPGQAPNLHYRFYYKEITGAPADDNALPCVEYNEYLPTSYNDIQTIDLTGYFGEVVGGVNTGVMFNDPSVNNRWQTGQSYAMGANVVPFRAYLIVENADSGSNFSIAGEAFIFEYGAGATWGYQAYMNGGFENADYSRFGSANPSTVAIMPPAEVSTSFMINAVDVDMTPLFEFDKEVTVSYGDVSNPIGIYDRDERPISGAIEQTIVCVGRVNAQDLLPAASQARLADGGWANLYNRRYERNDLGQKTATTQEAGVIVKLEYNLGATLDGQPVSGTFNNGLLLRPSAADNTQPGGGG